MPACPELTYVDCSMVVSTCDSTKSVPADMCENLDTVAWHRVAAIRTCLAPTIPQKMCD